MAKDSFTDSEKTDSFELRVPMITNGVKLEPGKHKLPLSVIEDLKRREHEYDMDKRNQLTNNGKDIDALDGGTIRG